MLELPTKTLLKGTNGYIVTAGKAQDLEYSIEEEGKCKATSYFFGRPKPGRLFDLWQRIGERGFSVSKIEGISKFPNGAVIDITANTKDIAKSRAKDSLTISARFRTTVK